MTRPIVCFDTETATTRGAPHLLEIGAVRVVEGEITDTFVEFARPEVPIDPEAAGVHGITEADVLSADPARLVLERFLAWVGDDWLAAHNARFDAHVLGFEAARAGRALPGNPLVDTLPLARRFIGEAVDHKLATLCQTLDLEIDQLHRALPDAIACWKVLEECADRLSASTSASVPAAGDPWSALFATIGQPASLADHGPKLPRLAPRLRPLALACRSQTRVTLVYELEAGSSELPVVPRLVYEAGERAYLEAECARSGLLKSYRLDRIRRVVVSN